MQNGHRLSDILDYTLYQVFGFYRACQKVETKRHALLVNTIAVGSRGSEENISKYIKEMVSVYKSKD